MRGHATLTAVDGETMEVPAQTIERMWKVIPMLDALSERQEHMADEVWHTGQPLGLDQASMATRFIVTMLEPMRPNRTLEVMNSLWLLEEPRSSELDRTMPV